MKTAQKLVCVKICNEVTDFHPEDGDVPDSLTSGRISCTHFASTLDIRISGEKQQLGINCTLKTTPSGMLQCGIFALENSPWPKHRPERWTKIFHSASVFSQLQHVNRGLWQTVFTVTQVSALTSHPHLPGSLTVSCFGHSSLIHMQ